MQKVCVVIDTNIWISSQLLKAPDGSALIHGIIATGAKIGLPKVIEVEVKGNAEKMLTELIAELKEKARRLESFQPEFGLFKSIPGFQSMLSPTEMIQTRLKELEQLIVRDELTFEKMKRALSMLLKKEPPNSEKNQQYKDSLIWQSILSFSEEYAVYFITKDKGFFKGEDYLAGPAVNIKSDIEKCKNKIEILSDIDHCPLLQERPKVVINENVLIKLIREELAKREYVPQALKSAAFKKFLTDNPDLIVVTYALQFAPPEGQGVYPRHRANGSCIFNIKSNEFSNFFIENIWEDQDSNSSSGTGDTVFKKRFPEELRVLSITIRENRDLSKT